MVRNSDFYSQRLCYQTIKLLAQLRGLLLPGLESATQSSPIAKPLQLAPQRMGVGAGPLLVLSFALQHVL